MLNLNAQKQYSILFGLPVCFSSYSVYLRCTSEGVVSMFNGASHSFFVCGSSRASVALPSCTRITCIQPLSRCSLTLLAFTLFSESVVVFSLFPLLLHHAFFYFFIFGLLAISYPLVSLPDLGSYFQFLLLSAFVYIPMLCHR